MRRGLTIFAAAVGALALAGVAAAKECKEVSGPFTAVLVPPPGCISPIGLCTLGTLTGDLNATYNFTMATLTGESDALAFTGDSTIARLHGGAQLIAQDTGTLNELTGEFTTIVNIIGGTKQYAGSSGQIVATGVINFQLGTVVGSYTGEICKHTS